MPRVATYEQRVGATPLPGERLTAAETPESEGAGLAQARAGADEQIARAGGALQQVAESISQIQTKHKTEAVDQANEIALLDASNQLDEGVNKILYDPDSGALNVRGKDAMGLPETTATSYNELADNVAAGLTNDKQRIRFAQERARQEQNLDGTIRRHVFGQINAYEDSELGSFLKNKQNNATSNSQDPRRVFEELGAGVDAIRTNAKRQGMGPEAIQAAVDAFTTDTHVGVIDNLLAQKLDTAAKTYFEETKDQINGNAAAKIEKAIAEGTLRGQAQKQADAIMAAGGTATQVAEKVKSIDDPELRDAVQERVEHSQAVAAAQARAGEEQMLNDAYGVVDRTHTVDSISPSAWIALGVHQPALREYADRLAKGQTIETDPVTYYGLMRQAADNPQDFMQENLLGSRAKLDNADFKQLADLQLRMKQGQKDDPRLGGFRTASEVIDDSLTRFGLDVKTKDKDTVSAIAELRTLVDKSVTTLEQSTGKKATPDDIQQITNRILSVPAKTQGSWWALVPFSGVPLGQFTSGQRKLADIRTISDVPAAEQQKIRAARDRAGLPTSDADVLQMYVSQLSGVYGGR